VNPELDRQSAKAPSRRTLALWRFGDPFLLLLILVACRGKAQPKRDDAAVVARDAGTTDANTGPWPELANLPTTEAVRIVALPVKADVPRFTVGGPVLAGGVAIVSSSQFGFIAIDWRAGQIVWSRPAGSRVAPPVVVDGNAVLIGECMNPPDVKADETLLACLRVVTPQGADVAYVAVHGKTKEVEAFAGSAGEQHVDKNERGIVWRRGESAVAIDLMTGLATPAPAEEPPLVIRYKENTWRIRRTEEGAITAEGKPAWRTERSYGVLIGGVYIPGQSPLVRVASATRHAGKPEILLLDLDATGSLHGQVSMNPAPGIGVIAHAIDSVGDAALAIRLDTSLERDFIAGYAANGLLMWTYALPRMPRADPIGIAIAHDAVVVFHDGDTFTVLPELSAPPTAPGAVRAPSENATP
jgi:hypothetical protein